MLGGNTEATFSMRYVDFGIATVGCTKRNNFLGPEGGLRTGFIASTSDENKQFSPEGFRRHSSSTVPLKREAKTVSLTCALRQKEENGSRDGDLPHAERGERQRGVHVASADVLHAAAERHDAEGVRRAVQNVRRELERVGRVRVHPAQDQHQQQRCDELRCSSPPDFQIRQPSSDVCCHVSNLKMNVACWFCCVQARDWTRSVHCSCRLVLLWF